MRRLLASFVLMSGAFALACGDVYVDPFPNEEGGELPPDINFPPPDTFPEPPTQCPTSMPLANTPCELPGSVCEYGRSANKNCNIILKCMGESTNPYWMRSSFGEEAGLSALCSPSNCEPSKVRPGDPCDLPVPDAGTFSDSDELVCNVSNMVCACSTGPDKGDPHQGRRWVCKQPISDCPDTRPLIGQPCSSGLWCDYGVCDYKSGMVMQCRNGAWIAQGLKCK